MQTLQGSRRSVAGYSGPADMVAYARKLTRQADAEQARMDRIRAERRRAQAKRAAR